MALGDVIARLAVNLSLETAAFEKGATRSEKRMNQMKRKFSDFGKAIQTGALAVAGAVVGLDKVFGDLAEKSKEIGNAAQVAGEGFEDFQRQAYGAKSVGIEFEKLGDIFKDVRDRIGDFAQTGGGPMADFFENIAPKVGVTAKAFEGLGGRDALQLYYDSLKKANVSQEDMVFYLEAMASDTTNLIPLLENGGKAWDEFGQKASVITEEQRVQLQKYEQAQLAMENAFQRITLALVDSGLLEGMADFAEQLAAVAEGFTGVEVAASETDETLRKTQGARSFGVQLRDANDALNSFFDSIDEANHKRAAEMRQFWRDVGASIADFNQRTIDWANSIKGAVADMGRSVAATAQKLYSSVKAWLTDKLDIVWDKLRSKIDWVADKFKWLDDVVVRNSYIPDMVDSIGEHMDRLQGLMVDPAVRATETTAQAFRTLASNVSSLLDRLFPEVARLREMYADLDTIDAGVSAGILSGDVAQEARTRIRGEARGTGRAEPRMFEKPMATIDLGKTMEKTIDSLSKKIGLMGEQSKLTTVKIAESFKDMVSKSVSALNDFASAIKGGGFLDILSSAVDLFLQLGSTGLFGKKLAANINRTPGYANGTSFHPGGLAMVGERGPELVSMPRGSKVFTNRETMGMMGGRMQVEVIANNNGFGAIVRDQAGQVIAEAAPSIMSGGAQLAGQQAQFHRSRRVA